MAARDALPQQARLCATVGRAVRDPSDLPRAMSEARATLTLGQDLHVNQPIVSVQSLALERMLATHGNLDAARQFVDDQIGILEKADSARSGQLSHTLDVLAACGGNKAEAAKRLLVDLPHSEVRFDVGAGGRVARIGSLAAA
jgi:purine catabolism regulator